VDGTSGDRRDARPQSDRLTDAAREDLARSLDLARVRDLVDLSEGRLATPLLDEAGIRALFASRPRIALVGASENPSRPSHGVMAGLLAAGYDVVPVTPNAVSVLGIRAWPTVVDAAHATGAIELVDVFRRAEFCAEHARDAVAAGARCLWLQQGIVNTQAGLIAHRAGLAVVMDRCTLVEHQRLLGHGGLRPG
jgi:predicted CoA-binding protein